MVLGGGGEEELMGRGKYLAEVAGELGLGEQSGLVELFEEIADLVVPRDGFIALQGEQLFDDG